MNIAVSLFAGLFFAGALAPGNAVQTSEKTILRNEAASAGYCHVRFPAIRPESLGSDHPVIQDRNSGDSIDYYGPCDENPLGQDQIQQQKLEALDQRSKP
jgi:hypothetical protein